MVTTRRLGRDDAERAICFLTQIVPGMSAADWRNLLLSRWPSMRQDIGVGLFDGDSLVGFLGTIFADRVINGRAQRFCNLHSCFPKSGFEARSAWLLLAALAERDCTLTAFTATPRVQTILETAGFSALEVRCRVFPLLPALLGARRNGARILTGSAAEPMLDAHDRGLVADHRPYACNHFVVAAEREYALMITKRRLLRTMPPLYASDVLHLGNPALAIAHFEQLKAAVLRSERTVMLRIDERMLGAKPPPGIRRRKALYFRSKTLTAPEIDNLYSELVLLPDRPIGVSA